MRVLLSEGASTSAREAITALGLRGHHVEVCDPDPHCLGRFSRFVRRFHRCPPLGTDPQGYLDFILDRLATQHFDVLLPIHEQGLLFAKACPLITPHVAVAVPSFECYERAVSKLGFSQLLSVLGLPQPTTRLVNNVAELMKAKRPPMVLKTPIGTASRGTWVVTNEQELAQAIGQIESVNGFAQSLLVQDVIEGESQQAQAVFADGRLIASHAYRQVARGAGGGTSRKESVSHPTVRGDLARIGEHLHWHGALSVDYIMDSGVPHYIDCNPRLVEPMSAVLAGVDLVDLLLRVSCGETPALAEGEVGVRSHLAVQALLGCAVRHQSRRLLLQESWHLLTKGRAYAGSVEELTPVRMDWLSFVPPTVTAMWLLASPAAAHYLPQKGWGAHLLTPETIRAIHDMDVDAMGRRARGGQEH
jgi:predicted ATP-grasp superfamily ATP-dependent carboligase